MAKGAVMIALQLHVSVVLSSICFSFLSWFSVCTCADALVVFKRVVMCNFPCILLYEHVSV